MDLIIGVTVEPLCCVLETNVMLCINFNVTRKEGRKVDKSPPYMNYHKGALELEPDF